jgi:hypothetical protein
MESPTFKRNVALVSFSNLEGTNEICLEMDELKDFKVWILILLNYLLLNKNQQFVEVSCYQFPSSKI